MDTFRSTGVKFFSSPFSSPLSSIFSRSLTPSLSLLVFGFLHPSPLAFGPNGASYLREIARRSNLIMSGIRR